MAGLDVHFDEEKRLARAATAALELPDLAVVEKAVAAGAVALTPGPSPASGRGV